jgi:dTDP-glucose 4,6-dehydratase/UDP-glucuronate decarboxylase
MATTLPSEEQVLRTDLDHIGSGLRQEFAEMAGHRLLITGGAGFLGYYLVQAVVHRNRRAEAPIRLCVYDNYVRGVPGWLARLEGEPHLEVVRHDMRNPLPEGLGDVDYVIHAAGIASPIYYRRHPLATIDANVNGLRNLLDHCVRQQDRRPVRGFLFYSSSEIYGDPPPERIPTDEEYRGNVSCTGPRACYDESKRFGETLCVTFAREHGLPVKVARPFNNYGPGLKISDRRVIPDFARDILAGRDIVMFSDGSPTRTFCYAADAVVGYYKVLVRGGAGEAYNIGIERPEVSVADLAERMVAIARDLLSYRGRLVKGTSADAQYLTDNPNRRCPDIGKARAQLGYDPRIDLDEGLRRSLAWYAHNREAEDA